MGHTLNFEQCVYFRRNVRSHAFSCLRFQVCSSFFLNGDNTLFTLFRVKGDVTSLGVVQATWGSTTCVIVRSQHQMPTNLLVTAAFSFILRMKKKPAPIHWNSSKRRPRTKRTWLLVHSLDGAGGADRRFAFVCESAGTARIQTVRKVHATVSRATRVFVLFKRRGSTSGGDGVLCSPYWLLLAR